MGVRGVSVSHPSLVVAVHMSCLPLGRTRGTLDTPHCGHLGWRSSEGCCCCTPVRFTDDVVNKEHCDPLQLAGARSRERTRVARQTRVYVHHDILRRKKSTGTRVGTLSQLALPEWLWHVRTQYCCERYNTHDTDSGWFVTNFTTSKTLVSWKCRPQRYWVSAVRALAQRHAEFAPPRGIQ